MSLHVAIIPDGNRRWAKEKGLIASAGHKAGGREEHMMSLLNEAMDLGIDYISFWGFSTENWKRDKKEVDELFNVLLKSMKFFRKECNERKIRFRHIGRRDRLPNDLLEEIESLEKETKENKKFNVQILWDYGGRDEIVRAVNKAIENGEKVDEKSFKQFLDTKEIPDPDLIIRTSVEKRLSGILPYQSTYAELYFAGVHFPDFGAKELRKAVNEFKSRSRTFGGNK